MKYSIFLVLLFFIGCSSPKKVFVPTQEIIFNAEGCGLTQASAQKDALSELSSILEVSIESSYESNSKSSKNKFINSSSYNVKSHTTFILKRVEYLNHTIETHIVSPDKHCITAVLTKTSLNAYIAELNIKKKNILQEISAANNHVKFKDKKKLIKSILHKIEEYNKFLQNLILLDTSLSEYSINETEHSLANKINAIPSVNFTLKKCHNIIHTKCTLQFNSIVHDDTVGIKYFWDFGDGSSSRRVHPTHRYRHLGEYDVNLVVIDKEQQEASETKLLIVENKRPIANFITREKVYSLRDHIKFINKSYDIDGKVRNYKWFFADNETSTKKNPQHQYSYPGTYRVRLKISDNRGSTSMITKRIIVKHPIEIDVHSGMTLKHVKLLIGQPEESVEKFNASVQSYLYYNYWIIVKDKIVQCIVHKDGFTKTLFGYPEDCEWHNKNRGSYLKH